MFAELTECRDTCETPLKISNNIKICIQPKKPGLCKTDIPRWWFNMSSCTCEQFSYSGCGANDNNFMSESDCQASCECRDCKCDLPIQSGNEVVCLYSDYILSYGFNKVTCQCEEFFYSGCGGNANRFPTREKCEARCDYECSTPKCEVPADPGSCQNYVYNSRYYYDKDTCQCKKYLYGECEGNGNNFETTEECLSACGGYGRCDNEYANCYLPKDSGSCDALVERFYYDHLACKCKKFMYGGCKGNANNFLSEEECNNSCREVTCQTCNLPKDRGTCTGFFVQYYYNNQTCQCEQFVYGGCHGNENRFETIEDCQGTCGSIQCPK
ncbi:Serine peptidase inhibitor [Mactra antiquata]